MPTKHQIQQAYGRGFDAYGEGVESNPYQWHSLKRGGPLLAGWWDAGYQDAKAGRDRRFSESSVKAQGSRRPQRRRADRVGRKR